MTRPLFLVALTASERDTVAALLGETHRLVAARLPVLTDPEGLEAAVAERVSIEQFSRDLRGRWYINQERHRGEGLHWIGRGGDLEIAIARAVGQDSAERAGAALSTLFETWVLDHGNGTEWALSDRDLLPRTTMLTQCFPDARILAIVGDGRNHVLETVDPAEGAAAIDVALERWEQHVRLAVQVGSGTNDHVSLLRFEDLILFDRSACIAHLERFLLTGPIRSAPNEALSMLHRLRNAWPKDALRVLDGRYERTIARLRDDGVTTRLRSVASG